MRPVFVLVKVGPRGLWFEVGMREEDYGWLRLRAAADCGPSLAPGGGLQDVRAEWQQAVLTFPWQLTTNLELFRRPEKLYL
jgi:hypothetical protein